MLRPYFTNDSAGSPHLFLLIRRPRDDGVRWAVPDVAAVHRRPFLIGLRHHRLAIGVQHEQPLWAMHEARPTPDAALALHAHQHVPLGEDADVAGLGPFVGMVERGARRAIAFLDFLPQVLER